MLRLLCSDYAQIMLRLCSDYARVDFDRDLHSACAVSPRWQIMLDIFIFSRHFGDD